jgi:hypothetical protein
MNERSGSGIVEALVGMALGGLAIGLLAASVLVGGRALLLARGVGAQVAATHDGLERLRRRAPGETNDLVGAMPAIVRRSERVDGRGRPDVLTVESTWAAGAGEHPLAVTSECAP